MRIPDDYEILIDKNVFEVKVVSEYDAFNYDEMI